MDAYGVETVRLTLNIFSMSVILLAITSCAVQNEKNDYRLPENAKNGLIVFSLSVTGSRSVYLAYRKLGLDEQQIIYVDSYGVKGIRANYDWKDPVGRLVYLELSEGEYEFFGWHPKYCGWDEQCLALNETIRFSVKPETASYVGNVHFSIISRSHAYKYEIRDEYERDISLLSNRLINVASDQVVNMLRD